MTGKLRSRRTDALRRRRRLPTAAYGDSPKRHSRMMYAPVVKCLVGIS
jgi:hypothetical protein